MDKSCAVARFVEERLQIIGITQREVAEKAGFEKPNMITMIKQGRTKLPMAKIGPFAEAIEVDSVELFQLCMSTYYPETWKALEPFMASSVTKDELTLINALRRFIGGPYLSAMSAESRKHFDALLESMRATEWVH